MNGTHGALIDAKENPRAKTQIELYFGQKQSTAILNTTSTVVESYNTKSNQQISNFKSMDKEMDQNKEYH